jgi:hAT family C-terminal dimerisation region
MATQLRSEYEKVEKLVRLLLVAPASSAEAERSFSALRRLKTWLRSTMTQH